MTRRPIIQLNGAVPSDRLEVTTWGATAMDSFSAMVKDPIKWLKDPVKTTQELRLIRKKIAGGDKIQAIKTAGEIAVQTAVAGALVVAPVKVLTGTGKFLFGSPKRVAGTLLTGGALVTSGALREGLAATPGRIIETGAKIGEKLEDILSAPLVPAGESNGVPNWLKVLGGAGVTAGLVAGGIGLVKDKIKDKDISIPMPNLPIGGGIPKDTPKVITPQIGAQPVAPALLPTESAPVIAVPEPVKADKIPPQKPAHVTVNNNIKINNRSSANKRFINNVSG